MRYLGASASAFFLNANCASSSSLGGGVVRVGDLDSNFGKKFLLARWANKYRACVLAGLKSCLIRSIVKLMRRVCWNIHGLPRAQDFRFVSAKREFEFSLEKAERFFEIVAVRRRPAAWRHEHIDQAKASGGVFARDKNRVGVADDSDVLAIFARRFCRDALQIIGRYGCLRFLSAGSPLRTFLAPLLRMSRLDAARPCE